MSAHSPVTEAVVPRQAAQVEIQALVKQYGSLRALNGVSFHIGEGEWVALMGPSGSGKTTLINILGGLDTLTSGRVVVDGVDLSRLAENQLVRYRAEKIGFVFQQFHLVPYLDALENVMLAQYFHSTTDEAEAANALKRVGLGERLTHLPAQLSGGEQQRVAIARALINQPKLILADEPTGNLDEANEQIVIDLFRELHKSGHTILMVTHDPDIARQADRRIELAHGHLSFDTAQHGPNHPMACPLADTADCCTPVSADDEIRVDHLLEQIWTFGEEGKPAEAELLRVEGPAGQLPIVGTDMTPSRLLARMADSRLVELSGKKNGDFNVPHAGEVRLTESGARRARDVVRRHRLAERLFTDTFAIEDAEAHQQACRFEHIITPELDQRICSFLGHPKTCPHGNPIPPGPCCGTEQK
ncbi:MAG TPA: ATP-binding cassette domain-containing protein [Candidatus Eisenbacteria bacterium]|jgi:putative ABC transport system ATP-binding protein|nr:ATP-binding cassette domain-containing protein [Candidatus Eisenbacteria bacterium]